MRSRHLSQRSHERWRKSLNSNVAYGQGLWGHHSPILSWSNRKEISYFNSPWHTCPGLPCHEDGQTGMVDFFLCCKDKLKKKKKASSILHLVCLFLWSSRQRARSSLFIFNLPERLSSPSPYCCWGGHYLLSNQCLAEAQAEDGWVCRLFLRMLF